MGLTKITQDQLDLGSETAVDLLAMQNGWKGDMINGINAKVPGNASASDTMPGLVNKFLSIVQDEDSDPEGYFSVYGRFLCSTGEYGSRTAFYLTGQPLQGAWSVSFRKLWNPYNDGTMAGIHGIVSDSGWDDDILQFDNKNFWFKIPNSDGSDLAAELTIPYGSQLGTLPEGNNLYYFRVSYEPDPSNPGTGTYSVTANLTPKASGETDDLSGEASGQPPVPYDESGCKTYICLLCPPQTGAGSFSIFDFTGFGFINNGSTVYDSSVYPSGVSFDSSYNPYITGVNSINYNGGWVTAPVADIVNCKP